MTDSYVIMLLVMTGFGALAVITLVAASVDSFDQIRFNPFREDAPKDW